VCTALALSNAITNLSGILSSMLKLKVIHVLDHDTKDNFVMAATVFGELWKLEPLCEEKKIRWRKEMDWLLSPTTYMVELVPTKQSGADGCTFEVISS
jgi:predicted secreted protein